MKKPPPFLSYLPNLHLVPVVYSEKKKERTGAIDIMQDMKRRVTFILIDGLGDVSLPRFQHQTTLQVANTPNLDVIASAGVNGLMDPVEAGLGCGSNTAHLSLLGFDPRVYYRGRGAFESVGAGLAMPPGDIAFKDGIYFYSKESRRIKCTKCGNSHIWICTTKIKASARCCQDCSQFYPAKDGEGWVEEYRLHMLWMR